MNANELLVDRFERALVYATRLHREQRREGSGTPYAAHLLGVASLVLEDGGTEDEAIAALLHDAAEDQGGRAQLDQIEREFGSDLAHIVEGCTDTDISPKPPWRPRKEAYVQALASHDAVRALVSAFRETTDSPLVDELDRVVTELEQAVTGIPGST